MIEEEQGELLAEQKHIAEQCGTIDYEHYLEFKNNVINGFIVFGDSFLEGLGFALKWALDRDAVKIIRTWRNECGVHEMLWKMHQAKQIVNNIEANSNSIQL
jgi:hypothetical protein